MSRILVKHQGKKKEGEKKGFVPLLSSPFLLLDFFEIGSGKVGASQGNLSEVTRRSPALSTLPGNSGTYSVPSLIPFLFPYHTSILPVSHTMVTCGIQSLTLLLCVVLILSTGAIIGGFTLTAWDDLLEKARDTGDEGFGMCLDSGTADIETVSSRYLLSVLGNVDTAVKEYLKVPEQLVTTLANLAQAHHPNVSTGPTFGVTTMNPAVASAFRAGYAAGIQRIFHETYPWCQAHPFPWSKGTGKPAGWGSQTEILHAFPENAVLPTDGTPILMVLEARDPVTLEPQIGDYSIGTEANTLGHIKDPTLPCNNYPNYNLNESRGMCFYPVRLINSPSEVRMRGLQLHYLHDSDPPLNPANELVYSGMQVSWSSISWDLSYTYTHPEMYTMYPKQGKRVGVVGATVTGDGVRDAVRNQLLPTGTSLYIVEEDQSTHLVGLVVAYNKGRHLRQVPTYMPPPMDFTVNIATSMNITNHSTEDATAHIPSVIGEHGQFVFTHPQNYRDLVEKTEDSFLKWSDSNSSEYWTMTSEIKHKTILWYANLLVPRESVMETIDASTNAIRAKVAADLSSADAQKEDAVIVMVIVTSVAIAALLAIAVVFTRYITSPLLKLGGEMASVAVMDLEAVDTGRAVSQLSEVGMMQRSFVTMVANLVEYRNYMPQSVLVNESEHEEVSDTESATRDAASRSVASCSKQSPSSSTEVVQNQKALLRVEGMKKKKVSLAHMNVVSWHDFCKNRKDAEVLAAHGGVMERILVAVQHNKGVCDTFAGDKMLATFNAFVPSSTHRVACVKAAHEVATALGDVHRISYGCTTGDARVGNMGCNGMKKVSILGQCMSWVVVLERWNKKHNLSGVIDRAVSREVEGQVVLRCAGAVLFAKLSDTAQVVYAVEGLCSAGNEEWMYQLESAANNPHALWNDAFVHIIKQDFGQASALLDGVAADQRGQYEQLIRYVQEKAYVPEVVDMH